MGETCCEPMAVEEEGETERENFSHTLISRKKFLGRENFPEREGGWKKEENMEERRIDRLENVPPRQLHPPCNDRLEKKRRREDLNQQEEAKREMRENSKKRI